MDYGIGMFLAGLVSGAGIGWFVGVLRIHLAYGNPEDLKRELMLYTRAFCIRLACLWMVTRANKLAWQELRNHAN